MDAATWDDRPYEAFPRGKVFISYALEDRSVADKVCQALEANAIDCWIAPRDIPPGANWGRSIIEAIDQTTIMIVIFSSSANRSPHVIREIERMVNSGGRIIPFRVEDVVPSKELEYFISSCQWLDATTQSIDREVDHLISALGEKPASPTRHSSDSERNEGKKRLWMLSFLSATVAMLAGGILLHRGMSTATTVRLQTPLDGAHVLGPVYLSWSGEGLDPENLKYELHLRTNTKLRLTHTVARTSSSRSDLKGPVGWRVRPVWSNPRGAIKFGVWSEWRHFTVYRDSLDRILATKTIRIGTAETGGLFVNIDNGKLGGFEIELLRILGEGILKQHGLDGGVEIEHVLCDWGEDYFGLLEDDKSVDLLASGISITQERRSKYNLYFTEPLLSYTQVVVTRAGVRVFENGRLLLGRLGVGSDTTNEVLGRKLVRGEESRLRRYSESGAYDLILAHLIEGKLDGALLDKPYAVEKTRHLSQATQMEFSMHEITPELEPSPDNERTAYALRQSDSRLVEALNSQLQQHENDKRELVLKFFGSLESYLPE